MNSRSLIGWLFQVVFAKLVNPIQRAFGLVRFAAVWSKIEELFGWLLGSRVWCNRFELYFIYLQSSSRFSSSISGSGMSMNEDKFSSHIDDWVCLFVSVDRSRHHLASNSIWLVLWFNLKPTLTYCEVDSLKWMNCNICALEELTDAFFHESHYLRSRRWFDLSHITLSFDFYS